jgi:hypothetical protein
VLFGVPPDHRPPGLAERVLLDPHLPQHVYGGYPAQPCRCPPVGHGLEHPEAVTTDLHGEFLPSGLALRQPPLVDTGAVSSTLGRCKDVRRDFTTPNAWRSSSASDNSPAPRRRRRGAIGRTFTTAAVVVTAVVLTA